MEEKLGFHELREFLSDKLPRILDPKITFEYLFKDWQEGRPFHYKINFIGMGNVGIEVAKSLVSGKFPLGTDVEEIHLCHRRVRQIIKGKQQEVLDTDGALTKTYDKADSLATLLNLGQTSHRKKIVPHEYTTLDDLYGVLTTYLDVNGVTNPLSDITIICPRYNYEGLENSDVTLANLNTLIEKYAALKRQSNEKQSLSDLECRINSILTMQANLASTFPDMPTDFESQEEADRLFLEKREQVIRELKALSSIAEKSLIAEKRIKGIKNCYTGIRELAKYFKAIDYQGLVIVVTNPADIMAYVFCKYSGLPASKVIAVCDNDRERVIECVRGELNPNRHRPRYKLPKIVIPVHGMHNEYQRGLIFDSRFSGTVVETGEDFEDSSFFDLGGTEEMWERAHQSAVEEFFPLEQDMIGSNAYSTARAIENTLRAVIKGGRIKEEEIPRVSGDGKFNSRIVYGGRPTVFELARALPYGDWEEYHPTENEKQRIFDGYKSQLLVFDRLKEGNLLEELTLEEVEGREKEYLRRREGLIGARKIYQVTLDKLISEKQRLKERQSELVARIDELESKKSVDIAAYEALQRDLQEVIAKLDGTVQAQERIRSYWEERFAHIPELQLGLFAKSAKTGCLYLYTDLLGHSNPQLVQESGVKAVYASSNMFVTLSGRRGDVTVEDRERPNRVKVWSRATKDSRVVYETRDSLSSLLLDEEAVLIGCSQKNRDGVIEVLTFGSSEPTVFLTKNNEAIYSVAVRISDGRRIVYGGGESRLHHWVDYETDEAKRPMGLEGNLRSLKLLEDQSLIFVGSDSGYVHVLSDPKSKVVRFDSYRGIFDVSQMDQDIELVLVGPDGKRIDYYTPSDIVNTGKARISSGTTKSKIKGVHILPQHILITDVLCNLYSMRKDNPRLYSIPFDEPNLRFMFCS